MKLIHLLAALGLVGLLAGCNSGPPLQGCDTPGLAFNPCSGLCETTPFSPPCAICENDPLACDPDASGGGATGGTGGGTGGTGGRGGGGADGADAQDTDAHTYLTGGGSAGIEATTIRQHRAQRATREDGLGV